MRKCTHTCKYDIVARSWSTLRSVSSSTAASGSKHPRQEDGDVEGASHAKKQRLDEGEGKGV